MRFRDILGLVIAIILAISIAFLTRYFLVSEEGTTKPPPEAAAENKILVAGKQLNVGEKIQAGNLIWQVWPQASFQETYVKEGTLELQSLTGSVVLENLNKGEPIILSNFVKPGERGILAALLPAGKRAISIPVTAQTSSSGLIVPGDYVDVILSKPGQSTTIVRNLKVIALDSKMTTSSEAPTVPKVATLEVTPAEAELITATSGQGVLSLSLYSVSETQKESVESESAQKGTVILMRGSSKTQVQVSQ